VLATLRLISLKEINEITNISFTKLLKEMLSEDNQWFVQWKMVNMVVEGRRMHESHKDKSLDIDKTLSFS